MVSTRDVAILLAKYPQPGCVKTRLIGPLTAGQAAEVHLRCLRLTLDCLSAVGRVEIVLAGSPDGADFRKFLPSGARFEPQGDGDLGARLTRLVERAFGAGAGRVLLVGSDCPGMCPEDVTAALDLLEREEVVVGPAVDGGYYLIGLRGPETGLFTSIDWGSSRVLAQTRTRAAEMGLNLALIGERRDVDEVGDMMALVDEIADGDPRLGSFKGFVRSMLRQGTHRE